MQLHAATRLDLVEIFAEIAVEKSCTPAQLALAWVLAHGNDIVSIPGTKRVRYLSAAPVRTKFELVLSICRMKTSQRSAPAL